MTWSNQNTARSRLTRRLLGAPPPVLDGGAFSLLLSTGPISFLFNHFTIFLDKNCTYLVTLVVIISQQLAFPALCASSLFLLSFLQPSTFQRSDAFTCFDVSLFLSHACALFCVPKKLNSLVFKQFQTLSQKHPGYRGDASPAHSNLNLRGPK
jgi:hypothetical protein